MTLVGKDHIRNSGMYIIVRMKPRTGELDTYVTIKERRI